VFAPFQMKVTGAGSMHPAFRLYDSATRSRGLWSRMPRFFWAAAAQEAAPGAMVLAQFTTAGRARPLVAEHFAGAGRVLFVGTDATFRWRHNIGDHLFYRFWGQAIRRVARSRERSSTSNWMEAFPGKTAPGESVSIELYAVDADGGPLDVSEASVRAVCGDSVQTVVLGRSAEPGHYRGTWSPVTVGDYQLSYTGATGSAVNAAVRVAQSGLELRRPGVDRDTLGNMAQVSGGGLLELDAIDQLPKRLKGEPVTLQRTHEEELWDNWMTLVLLVMLYCTDVFVRRMSGLT
jgi:hypothetical protein